MVLGQVGPKTLEQATRWVPTLAAHGFTASALIVYFTEWKVVGQYIPFWGSKLRSTEE